MGLIAMLCWGFADFFQALAIKKTSSLKIMFFSNLLGFFPTIIAFFYFLLKGYINIDLKNFLIISFGAFINLFAIKNFLKSYEEGEISIVTPISASYSIITVILSIIFLGEILTKVKILSISLCILGIFLVSTDFEKIHYKKLRYTYLTKGIKESIFAFLGWGVYFFIIGFVSKNLSNLNISKINSATSLFFITGILSNILLICYSYIKAKKQIIVKNKIINLEKKILFILIFNFFLYNIAWIAVNYGIALDYVSIIAPISSLYPAITVILSSFFLKEKLLLNQKTGIILTILAMFLISF